MAPRSYTIVVEGELGSKYRSAFPGMRLEPDDGLTTIAGPVRDQAHLRGILDAIATYSLNLVSVTPADAPATPTSPG